LFDNVHDTNHDLGLESVRHVYSLITEIRNNISKK